MSKIPGIAMLATAVLLVYSFFVIHPDASNDTATVSAASNIQLYVNGEKIEPDAAPQIVNGSTFVPIRWVADALGADIGWNAASKSVRITKGDTTLRLTVDSAKAVQGDETVTLAAKPYISQNRTFVPVRWISEALALDVEWQSDSKTVIINEQNLELAGEKVSVVGDADNLMKLLSDASKQLNQQSRWYGIEESAVAAQESATADSAASDDADYSGTNVQVGGVDEADVVKTDGKYIFQLNKGHVLIAKATPADQLELVNSIDVQAEGLQPSEMYVDDDYIVVIGTKLEPFASDKPTPFPKPLTEDNAGAAKQIMIMPTKSQTAAIIYDRNTIENIEKVRELELDGYYVTSRKVGSSLYLVTNYSFPMYRIMENENELPIPAFRDSSTGGLIETANLNKMIYRPDHIDSNYLIVAGVNLDQPEQKMDVTTFLGAGSQVYASKEHLYAVMTEYDWEPIEEPAQIDDSEEHIARPAIMPHRPAKQNTVIYQFSLDEGNVTFTQKGEVPGRVLNQFSMDEHQGHFRIATTTGEMWSSGDNTSKNHLFILDDQLQITGSVEDLAPGERIYSVRFMGDRGYVVTFRTVDPLFVLDLANPSDPELLGELKIPGYSDYLHPYDENHLIGFGMDTIVVEHKDESGRVTGETAYTQGMKMSLFDITDVHNPIEKFTETIGDRGTHSPLLHNHKALMFAKDKNLMAFPVTVMEIRNGQVVDQNGYPHYGEFVFQGAYVYEVDPDNGFQLQTKISHLSEEELKKSGLYGSSGEKYVERTLYIGNALYTLSQQMIQAHQLNSFDKIDELQLP